MGSFAPRPAQESARLKAVSALNLCDAAAACPLDDLAALAASVFGAPFAAISLMGADTLTFLGRSGVTSAQAPRDGSFCAHVVANSAPLFITDARQDPRTMQSEYVLSAPYLRNYGGAPVFSDDGYCVGVFCVMGMDARVFSAEDQMRLLMFADLASQRLQSHLRDAALSRTRQQCLAEQARTAAVLEEAGDAFAACDKLAANLGGRFSAALLRLERALARGDGDVALEAAALRDMAGDLAALARLETPRSPTILFEPSRIVRELVAEIGAFPTRNPVRVTLADAARGIEILGDEQRFEELLENLFCDVLDQSESAIALTARFETAPGGRAAFILRFSGETGWETHEPWALGSRTRDLIEAMSGAHSHSCDERALVVTLPARLCAPARGASADNVVSLDHIKRGKVQ